VEECRAAFGATPVDLLARSVKLDRRWNLVHATHATGHECALMRDADVTVVLCPITEAYLGDGLFSADEFIQQGGRIAVGSDSNCRIDAIEELRLMEYGQRLRSRQRARLATAEGLGVPLWQRACAGGAAALGEPVGALAPGQRADILVLERHVPPLLGHDIATCLDALIIGGSRHDLAKVYVGGKLKVERGAALAAGESAREFAQIMLRLNAS
jgi:cytosine/adenosine deaminase-related metal-dependent hydrolase